MPALFFILTSVFCSSFAHIALKLSAPKFSLEGNLWEIFFKIITNYWLLAGLILHLFALFLWVVALKKTELSYAYPFITLGFVIVTIFSYFIFKEEVSALRLTGLAITSLGILVIAYS
jgi:multidrug transporter EmrE-like cation transporter